MKRLLTALLFAVLACDNPLPTAPDPDPLPPPLEDPVRERLDAPFQWDSFAGYTGFALGYPEQTEGEILALVHEGLSYGWNTVRMCSETEFWDGSRSYLKSKPKDPERLRWTLEVLASVPSVQVLLIGDCTLKRQVPLEEAREWARVVASIASEFQNIAIETHNEWRICRGRTDWNGNDAFCPTRAEVRAHIRIYRAAGIQWVTADDSLCRDDFPDGLSFEPSEASPADFHPCREFPLGSGNPWDPTLSQIRQLQRRYGLFVFSETVALGDVTGECRGLRTCDISRIQSLVNRCAQADAEAGEQGCKIVFHSEALLGGDRPGQWPRAR